MDTKKILYLGSFRHAWSTERYIAQALTNLGHDVTKLEETQTSADRIIDACKTETPDLFLFAKGRFAGADGFDASAACKISSLIATVRWHVGQVCSWQFDLLAPDFCRERWAWAETVATACDVFATTDGYSADRLPNAAVVRQGIPPDLDHDADWPEEYAGDVLFLGTAYRDRHALVENLRARFGGRFAVVNNVRGPELTALCRSYRIVVGPHYPSYPGYWSNRIYVVTGAGGLFACPTVDGMASDGWRPSTNYLALPASPPSMAAKLAELIEKTDRGQLRSIQRAGYEHAKTLTYEARCLELLRHLDVARDRIQISEKGEPSVGNDEPTEVE